MSNQIKESEISELQKQNAKRNIASMTFALFGLGAGYWVFANTKASKKYFLTYLLGGALVLGGGYRLLTMTRATRRKSAIHEKKALILRGDTKPAPANVSSDSAPTTVVDLTPTGTSKPNTGMIYKN